MIPHKIQLKNFLSYGPQLQTIDFSSYSLICLSGKNGHGKSALLDAITWALWGQGRKVLGTAKADAGLLRLGQTHMLVIFDFEFSGKSYRIRREYMETYGKPLSVLEFGLVNPTTQEFIPLTDKTIRTTQAKIEQTLRLDFDSFSNSAFLRQGNSNEFSKKSPKDRKQILASILGLDQYEVIRKRALDKIREANTQKTVLIMLQEKRLCDLANQENITHELASLEQQIHDIASEEKQWHCEQKQIDIAKKDSEKRSADHHFIQLQMQQLCDNKKQLLKQLHDIRTCWRTINKKKHNTVTTEQLEQQKKAIITAINEKQKQFQYNLEQKEALLHTTQELHACEQLHRNNNAQQEQFLLVELERLRAEHNTKNSITLIIEDELKKYTQEYEDISKHIDELNKVLNTSATVTAHAISIAETQLEKRKTKYQHFVSLGNWISTELNNILQKKKLVHLDDASCPLCEQNLSASRRRLLRANFDKNESFLSHRLHRLKRIIPTLKEMLVTEHAQLSEKKSAFEQHTLHAAKKAELTVTTEKITTLNTQTTQRLLTLQKEILDHEAIITQHHDKIVLHKDNFLKKLANDRHYQELNTKKAALESELSKNPYNAHEYAQLQEQLSIIEHKLNDVHLLKNDIAQQKNRLLEVHKICTALKKIKLDEHAFNTQLIALGDIHEKNSALKEKEEKHKALLSLIREKQDDLLKLKGSAENQQKQLKKIKDDYDAEQKNIALFNTTIDDYQIISTATGKDGIQALLIEEAIPEIEQETNQLLSQLTNNQAQIFIESLRDLKKGGTKETLDIKISDQNGIRPYEMFSGGEAFRIDFALRIAISKLLARRAGTALQTLIIDEGFGSQDEEGLSHIMDALHTIQSNFSKIIIVSHLPAMKDQFPVHFHIHKGVQGSVVNVIEQG